MGKCHPVKEVNTKGQFFRASFGRRPQVPNTARQAAPLQEVPGHRRVGSELPVVQSLRGPACDGLVHAVLHRQHPQCPGSVPLRQALHQAERQPRQRGPARGQQRGGPSPEAA